MRNAVLLIAAGSCYATSRGRGCDVISLEMLYCAITLNVVRVLTLLNGSQWR